MRPVLFTIFGRKFQSYLIVLYLGLVTGVFAAIPAARSAGISPDRFVIATLILIVPALAGARLLYVLMHWHFYLKNPHLIWLNRRNGAALYGGLILVVLASIPVLRLVAIPFWPYWDAGIVTCWSAWSSRASAACSMDVAVGALPPVGSHSDSLTRTVLGVGGCRCNWSSHAVP